MYYSCSLPTFTTPCMFILKYKMPSFPLKLFNMKIDSIVNSIFCQLSPKYSLEPKGKKIRLIYSAVEHKNVKCEVLTPEIVY